MKATVLDLDGNQKKEINLPAIFEVEYRPDLINRVVSASQSMQKQPQGRDPMAGKRNTAYSWGPGRGNARVPRINGSGTGAANQGAFAPMTVGGRLAHPPRVAKTLEKKVNKKEKAIAFQSAVSATANPSLVKQRGHIIDGLQTTVLILDDKFQTLKRTSALIYLLEKLGLKAELERASVKRIRSGKGKRRGRKYKCAKGPLIVAENFGIREAAQNIPGVDFTSIGTLCVEDLAPGGHAGRLVIWAESSINALSQRM